MIMKGAPRLAAAASLRVCPGPAERLATAVQGERMSNVVVVGARLAGLTAADGSWRVGTR